MRISDWSSDVCSSDLGGAIAYVPFLTIWLPSRMTELAGPADVQTLGYVTFFGAIAASAGGIIFGWFSDRTHSRRAWVFAGMVLSVPLPLLVPLAKDVWTRVGIIIPWQLNINMLLGPLVALPGAFFPA